MLQFPKSVIRSRQLCISIVKMSSRMRTANWLLDVANRRAFDGLIRGFLSGAVGT